MHSGIYMAPVTGSIMIADDGVLLGSVLGVNFDGDNVEVVISGSWAHVTVSGSSIGIFTYSRSGMLIALAGETGVYWQVPDQSFATGSVAIMVNGIWQRPVIDFTEQYAVSGTILLDEAPITGSVLAATWGVVA
jgi:hypothetical protein